MNRFHSLIDLYSHHRGILLSSPTYFLSYTNPTATSHPPDRLVMSFHPQREAGALSRRESRGKVI